MGRKKLPPDVLEFFRRQGKRGGKTAAQNMTPDERRARAKKASIAGVAARRAEAKTKPEK